MNTVTGASIAFALLSSLITQKTPWLNIQANSEQRQPVYVGASPCAMMLEGHHVPKPVLPDSLRQNGESYFQAIAQVLKKMSGESWPIEFEAWPAQNDTGDRTWVIARFRRPGERWQWLDAVLPKNFKLNTEIEPMLSALYHLSDSKERHEVLADFIQMNSLYDKPVFGDCVFTSLDGQMAYGGWLDLNLRKALWEDLLCHALPQPARLNEQPISFVIKVQNQRVIWPQNIQWLNAEDLDLSPLKQDLVIQYPPFFGNRFMRDVKIFAGESVARFPYHPMRWRLFRRKNNAELGSQLEQVVDYLQERYQKLAIKTFRQKFFWQDRTHSNLIAVIPGSLPPSENHPVLLADHIDTAFAEDVFEKTGRRVSVPGADDNAAATAGLLRAAEALRSMQPKHDIWLVHLTGEEFPADDLGARVLVSSLLRQKRKISGLILMDMIGYNANRQNIFQINAGDSNESLMLARVALGVAHKVTPKLYPVIRTRFHQKSYLFNTDGVIFSDVGYSVILLNEHINRHENSDRPYYHQKSDRSQTIDWDYAISIVKVAIETVARLALVTQAESTTKEKARSASGHAWVLQPAGHLR